jgi:hypothetical protein
MMHIAYHFKFNDATVCIDKYYVPSFQRKANNWFAKAAQTELIVNGKYLKTLGKLRLQELKKTIS